MAKASGRDNRILIRQFDVSSYFQNQEVSSDAEEHDVTVFGDQYRAWMAGLVDSEWSLSGFFDAAVDASDDVIDALKYLNAEFACTSAPIGWAVGNPVFMLSAVLSRKTIDSDVREANTIDAVLAGGGGTKLAHCLLAPTAVTPTGAAVNGAGVDNPKAASTNHGARAHLHVIANTYTLGTTFKVQHSADNSTFADLVTFAVVAAATKTSEVRKVADGVTINRYVRSSYVGGAGANTLQAAIGFQRNY